MNFISDNKVVEYDNVLIFLNDWIVARHAIYIKRFHDMLIDLMKKYIIHFNYTKIREKDIRTIDPTTMHDYTPRNVIE